MDINIYESLKGQYKSSVIRVARVLGWDSREGGREVQLGKEVKYKGEEEAEEVVEEAAK